MSNLLTAMLEEASTYTSWEKLERYLEENKSLAQVPLLPLAAMLKKITSEEMAIILPSLSPGQRQGLLDLDAWKKDQLDVDALSIWPKVYALCPDEKIQKEFVRSETFLLFLKARINIWTFDQEDPQYPDHDFYFLTDDQLLLFEYDQHFTLAHEVQFLVRVLYEELGVEQSYALLFKLVADSFLVMEEEEYRLKRERLREFGQVDYYEALELLNPFPSEQYLQHFLAKKEVLTPLLSVVARAQTLPSNYLVALSVHGKGVLEKLERLNDQNRVDYLRFNLVRLLSAAAEYGQNLYADTILASEISKDVALKLELAIDYLSASELGETNIFARFDFVELHRLGNTLLSLGQKKIKRALSQQQIPADLPFLGRFWLNFLEGSFAFPTAIKDLVAWDKWRSNIECFEQMLPLIATFWHTFTDLQFSGAIRSDFYLNYQLEDIDFEAIILSNFANFYLGYFQEESQKKKMGIAINDYQHIVANFCDKNKIKREHLVPAVDRFAAHFGFSKVPNFSHYFLEIFEQQLLGIDFRDLTSTDYRHVGGPIILLQS